MKAMRLHPAPMATAVAACFGRRVWPLIGILLDDHEKHLKDEVRRDIESQRVYVLGVFTLDEWNAGMQKMRESEYEVVRHYGEAANT